MQRSSRRSSDRSHPCQIKGAGFIVGNHYDDRIVYRQFKDSGTCKPADLYRKTIFDNDLVNSIFKGNAAQFSTVVIILIITLVMKYLLDWYMSTKSRIFTKGSRR